MLSKLSVDEILAIAKSALHIHPNSEPIDLYKLFFQAHSGPSHMIKDRDKAAEMIYQEANNLNRAYLPITQTLGDAYLRLSLSVLGFVTMKESKILASWMLDSCIDDKSQLVEFQELWPKWIDPLQELLPADHSLWQETLTLAKQGSVPSHSKLFHQHYDPHYRIVNPHLTNYYNYFFGE